MDKNLNIDSQTVDDFGREWNRFQQDFNSKELKAIYENYFSLFPFKSLPEKSQGFDMGCGSGRWSAFIAPKVAKLYCVDPSKTALKVAKKNLKYLENCIFENASANNFSVQENSMDFGFSLGVLHHVPDTQEALNFCVSKLKQDAPFLLYLYYNFDNRGLLFRSIWLISDFIREFISKLPFLLKKLTTDFLALFIYLPLARISLAIELLGIKVNSIPLSYYRNKSFYTMRTDSLDRFGTRLEKRFSKSEIKLMMKEAGLERIKFSDSEPYWVALGYKSGQ